MRTIFGHSQWGTIVCDEADRSIWLKVPFGSTAGVDLYVHDVEQFPTIDDVTPLDPVATYLVVAREQEPRVRQHVVAQIREWFAHLYGRDEHGNVRPDFSAGSLMASIQLSFITLHRDGDDWWGFRSGEALNDQTLMVGVSRDFETLGDVSLLPP